MKSVVVCEFGVLVYNVYYVSVMLCYDKKFEVICDDFESDGVKDVDVVFTTGEVVLLLEKVGLCYLRDVLVNDFDVFVSINE